MNDGVVGENLGPEVEERPVADRVDRAIRRRPVDVVDDPGIPILEEAPEEFPGDVRRCLLRPGRERRRLVGDGRVSGSVTSAAAHRRRLRIAHEDIEAERLKATALVEAERLKAIALVEAERLRALAEQVKAAGLDPALREVVADTHQRVADIHHRVADDK